ncbi:diaminobutyrate acetyltransferase [Porticoccaceae bacterium LTM1]|nr:diaminobutyrate acetyltransferase [Porticoccaceae bacterium LTM1]
MNGDSIEVTLRLPTTTDGARVHGLVANCPPLDPNSMYCNLLQCSHFSATSVAAEQNGELVGFISGYILPDTPNTLFIWQVAVGEAGRGKGLATRMLKHILSRPECSQVNHLETTITASNLASWALFRGLAEKLNTRLVELPFFDRDTHFNGEHDSELLARIGPFNTEQI